MINPLLLLGALGAVTMNLGTALSEIDSNSLHQITGKALEHLVLNSTVQYGSPPIKGGNFSIFGADHRYQFKTNEPWGVVYNFHFEQERVVIESKPEIYIMVFEDKVNNKYLTVSNQPSAGYQPVVIRHLQPGEHI